MGNTKGYIPQYQELLPAPPTPFQSMDCGIWPLSIWLCDDPEPFCPLGTPVTWTISFFSFKMQSDLTVIATGISILLQYRQPHPGAQ